MNDVWVWTDRVTGRDYALVARRDGASFVDVTDPSAPSLVGNLPRTVGSPPSVWRRAINKELGRRPQEAR